jgi:hypothetical protein
VKEAESRHLATEPSVDTAHAEVIFEIFRHIESYDAI